MTAIVWCRGPFRDRDADGNRVWRFLAKGNGRSVAVCVAREGVSPHVCLYLRELPRGEESGIDPDLCFGFHPASGRLVAAQLPEIAVHFLTCDVDAQVRRTDAVAGN